MVTTKTGLYRLFEPHFSVWSDLLGLVWFGLAWPGLSASRVKKRTDLFREKLKTPGRDRFFTLNGPRWPLNKIWFNFALCVHLGGSSKRCWHTVQSSVGVFSRWFKRSAGKRSSRAEASSQSSAFWIVVLRHDPENWRKYMKRSLEIDLG